MPRELFDPETPFEVAEHDIPGVEDPDPDVVYTIRSIDDAKHQEIEKRHTPPPRYNRETHQQEARETDQIAVYHDCVDYLLIDWRGIQLRGEPVPCERVHKLRLDNQIRLGLFRLARLNRKAAARDHSFRATE